MKIKSAGGLRYPAFFALLLSATFLVWTSLDELAEITLESIVSKRLNAEVQLGRVNLDFTRARATLKQVRIGNPPGFSGVYAIKLEEVAVFFESLFVGERPIHISKIEISKPEIVYEYSDSGNNIERLLARASDIKVNNKDKTGSKPDSIVDIDNLVIHPGQIRVYHQVLKEKSFELDLPYMDLQGLRQAKKEASSEKVSKEILSKIKTEIGVAIASASIRTGL